MKSEYSVSEIKLYYEMKFILKKFYSNFEIYYFYLFFFLFYFCKVYIHDIYFFFPDRYAKKKKKKMRNRISIINTCVD